MNWKKIARIGLPILFALLLITGLLCHSRLSDAKMPLAKNGVLDLTEWNGKKVFEITGEWEFYWDNLLNIREIREGSQVPMIVEAPDKWNNYEINGAGLPGKGKATYRMHVTGAEPGALYGARIQNLNTVRLYMDNTLIAQNGSLGDKESIAASAYRPQLVEFTPNNDSFDLILQVENNIIGIGGMMDPVLFGTYEQILTFDKLLSNIGIAAITILIVAILFFVIFFVAQHGEKEMLILCGLGILILLRFLMIGDVLLTAIFPETSISAMIRLEFLSVPWTQFLLLYFVYYSYGNLVRRWHVAVLFIYSVSVSLFVLLFSFYTVTSAAALINFILLLLIAFVTMKLTMAAWQEYEGASLLLGALWLILLMVFYQIYFRDRSVGYYLFINLHLEYFMLILAQIAVVAKRYHHAQELEIAHLKGQIRPHFIHNSLTTIISISRTKPDRARELLVDFSSYLRGFYDYESDEMVPFSQELELVSAYVALEQARFGEKLHVEYCIESKDFLLPPLMLQPLVENAFIHGLREKDNGGTVTIYSKRIKNGKIRVGVRDDGIGLIKKGASSRRGVGTENINRRLSKLYRTSLVFLIPDGGGCEVYLEIPHKKGMKYEGLAD